MTHAVVLTGPRVTDDAVSSVARSLEALAFEIDETFRYGETAVELKIDAPPPREPMVEALQGLAIDANAVPLEGRRKAVLLADMDSTIITTECIDELADFAGIRDRVARITEAAMAGELDFEAALRERVGLLKGLSEEVLERVWEERIQLTPGARAMVRSMRGQGAETILVSGGFTAFTRRVAKAAGFAQHRANQLEIEDGVLTGRIAGEILGRSAKLEALRELTLGIGERDDAAVAVGDGANDIDMVSEAGLGVAFRAKPALEAEASAIIRHADLTAVLHLQGYTEDEILMA